MSSPLDEEVADSLDATMELMPFIPALLGDLAELGTPANDVVDLIKSAEVTPRSRAIDLGCGKGAIAIALAERLGLVVTAVDAFAPFIEEAERQAREQQVSDRCSFRVSDLREELARSAKYDLVIMAGVGSVLGDISHTVEMLGRVVREGGHILISDAFLAEGVTERPAGYEDYFDYAETVRLLTLHCDGIVRERIYSQEEDRRMNRANTEAIRRRAEELIRAHPEAEALLRGYVKAQEEESFVLEEYVTSAMWLLKKH